MTHMPDDREVADILSKDVRPEAASQGFRGREGSGRDSSAARFPETLRP